MASTIKCDTIQSTTANVFFQNSSGTEYARFDSSGNLGIGTTTPGAKLDVRGSSTFLINAANPTAWVSSDSTLVTQSMYMQVNTTSSDTRLGSYTNHPLLFLTNNAERMRINSSGNVGIGTSSPSSSYIAKFLQVDNATSSGVVLNAARKFSIYSSSSSTLSFLDETAGAERMRIDSSGNLSFNSGYGSVATAYGCRAWVNFNGTTNVGGFCTIRASGNVTSVTDNGTGDYTVNFTTAMPDANYSVQINCGRDGSTAGGWGSLNEDGAAPSTSACRIRTGALGTGPTITNSDRTYVSVAIFR